LTLDQLNEDPIASLRHSKNQEFLIEDDNSSQRSKFATNNKQRRLQTSMSFMDQNIRAPSKNERLENIKKRMLIEGLQGHNFQNINEDLNSVSDSELSDQ